VAGNRTPYGGPDILGPVSSDSSYNLVGDDTGLSGIGNGTGGNLVGSRDNPIDPRLGPLADNGGPTLTHALLDDSPARGAGSLDFATDTDQRGLPRTTDGEIDLGSFQTQIAVAGPQVAVSDPGGVIDPPVDHLRLTFNHPMDLSSVTADQFGLTGPGGSIDVTGVAVVPSTNDQQFDVSFASQAQPGDYALVIGADVQDSHGTSQGNPFTDRFVLFGLSGSILTVNSTQDTANDSDPYLTLREAIAIVNSPTLPTDLSPQILAQISAPLHAHGSDTIVFDSSRVSGPIVLGGRQLELRLLGGMARVRIDGGVRGVTLDGNRASRLLEVDAGVGATLDHLTLTHGSAGNGGGILSLGTLTVTDSTISSNSSSSGSYGGGIYNQGTLTVTDSTISSNSANYGGGLYSAGTLTVTGTTLRANLASSGGGLFGFGLVTVSDCTLLANTGSGGGIYGGDTMTVSHSTFSSNSGSGIFNYNGRLTVNDCTFSSNSAGSGGGIENWSTATVSHCTFRYNFGGGGALYNLGTMTVTDSTLESNSVFGYAAVGGGILNVGTLTVTNCTIQGNSALSAGSTTAYGGGIYNNSGTLTMINCTIQGNSAGAGGGIDNYSGPAPTLENTIVAGNLSMIGNGPDINGSVQSTSSYNLVGIADSTLSGISDGTQGNQVGTPTRPIVPLLDPLGDYGGPTLTMRLRPGSPALGSGDPAQAGTLDQRGVARTGLVNIGAFQASFAALVVSAPASVTAGDAFDVTVSAIDPYGQAALGYTGTITFSSGDPHGATLPADYTFTLADSGSHTFVGSTALYTAGTRDVTATDLASNISGSANVEVNAGSAVGFVVMAPTNAVAGVPFDVTVVAVDAYGNQDGHYAGTIHFSTSDQDPAVELPPDTGFQGGRITFYAGVTLFTSGDQSLTVTDLDTGMTGSTVVTL
jgi:hypothetical protein